LLLRLSKKYKNTMLIICLIFFIIVLAVLICALAPNYFESQQAERDSTIKCKSYRALEKIAVAMYREDPNGDEWLAKAKEAEMRRKQYRCSQLMVY